ncbi:MAG: M43 family zinc metalloprotease [Flavobacteriales bacterium]|mgnify:CR=1 FL=1|nr:MAG: M43 family zinc metalloprotease [Flavobacteriales bacterium]
MRYLFPALAIATLPLAASAQSPAFTCGTNDDAVLERLHGNDPALLGAIAAANAELEAWTAGFSEGARSTYVIPVVFHIIHNHGPENISDEQVLDAMRILNEDFNRQNPDWDNVRAEFLPLVANVDIEFRLARKDPNGNCTRGITRTVSALTNDGTQDMKDLIQWPRNKYLNVWVAASAAGAAGYTLTPGSVAFFAAADGIVMQHTYVGSIGTGSPSRSRALTHEVGHWINLEHTWGGSNTPAVSTNCSTDDGVSDTPNTIGWTSCNLSGTTCGSLDNVENFMEYSYCSKMFTLGQKTRMVAALTSSTAQRNQLITANNLTATGVSQPEALCAAEFTASNRVVCQGESVTFTDVSYNAVSSRSWSFAGGSPATATSATATVTYDAPGTYAVSLTASDGSTSLTNNQSGYITVLPVPGTAAPFEEGFEAISAFNAPDWFVENPQNDNTWTVTTAAAFTGAKSTRIVNTAAMDGRVDELVSRTYDMSGATQVVLSFRYAYAKRTSNSDDALRVYTSTNCGDTWSLRKVMRGSTTLTTGGVVTSSFIPNGPGQWSYTEVTNISSVNHVPNFRFKFEFESDGGNNLYLDDINLNGLPVGLDELQAPATGLAVLPNPASGHAQALVHGSGASMLLEIIDLTGRVVHQRAVGVLAEGEHRIDLPIAALSTGTYLLRISTEVRRNAIRFTVQ